jgi:hypothetical protein
MITILYRLYEEKPYREQSLCGKTAINPDKFDKLITALRTAVDNDETLEKESTSPVFTTLKMFN